MKFILICVTLDLSDNLTEMRIVKNYNVYMKLSQVVLLKQKKFNMFALTLWRTIQRMLPRDMRIFNRYKRVRAG